VCEAFFFVTGEMMSEVGNDDFLVAVKKELNDCLDAISNSHAAFIATVDGHLLVDKNRSNLDLEPLCPMSGSLIGISIALSAQLNNGQLEEALIRTNDTVMAAIRINDENNSLLLGIVSSKKVNLGTLVLKGRECADRIKDIIEEPA